MLWWPLQFSPSQALHHLSLVLVPEFLAFKAFQTQCYYSCCWAGDMTVLVARLFVGPANDVTGHDEARCPLVKHLEQVVFSGLFFCSCCCIANTGLLWESMIRYPLVDKPPTCKPSRQTSSLIHVFPSSALTAVHIQAVLLTPLSHNCCS